MNRMLKNPFAQSIIFLSLLYLLLPSYLSTNSYLCEIENVADCLDASWVLSINWALQKHLIFGQDYIFTYGPLGFLGTRNALGFNPLFLLFSDLFIIINCLFISIYTFRKFYNLQAAGLCLLVVYTMSGGVGMYSDQIVFVLLLISVFWLNYSLAHSSVISLTIPAIITCILFYLKANMSFINIILFYVYLAYFIFSDKKNSLPKILYGLAVPLIIFLLSFPLRTDIFSYIAGNLSLIDGYNDAMSINLGDYAKYLGIAVISILAFLISFFVKNFRQNLLLFLTFGIFTFVLFKQSFVRSDLHVAIFFTFFPAVCGVTTIFYKRVSAWQTVTVCGIGLVCLTACVSLLGIQNLSGRINYLKDVLYPVNTEQAYENSFDRFKLPEEVTRVIGSHSVDVIPWNINYLYFNRLNYNPRPLIQSYSAYTPYLINLNKQKYEGETAPEFVLFSNHSIDKRYSFFDDQEVKLSLIRHYSCLGIYNAQGNDFLLFKRNDENAVVKFSAPSKETLKLNDAYFLKDTNKSYFIKIDIDYSYFGKLVRTAYKPFLLAIYFTLEDGTERRYKAVVPILKNGVLINPLIENETDFLNLIQGNPVPDGKKIKSFRIDLDSPGENIRSLARTTFKPEINLSISEISIDRKAN